MYPLERDDDHSWYDRNPYQRYPDDPFYWPSEEQNDDTPFKPIGYSSDEYDYDSDEEEFCNDDDRGDFSYSNQDFTDDYRTLTILLAKEYKLSYDNRVEVGMHFPLSKREALELVNKKVPVEVELCERIWESEEKPTCPHCQLALVPRQNSKTKQVFLGCSRFPKCKYTKVFRP